MNVYREAKPWSVGAVATWVVAVEPDYEAAKVPATDTFAMFASKMLGISHAEAMQRDDVQEAGAIIAAATIDAALGIGEDSTP